jgi:hypothetical protein
MKYAFLISFSFSIIQCRPDEANETSLHCQESIVPTEWVVEERINYNFCFPKSYQSIPYLWKRSNPYASLSQGISNELGNMMPLDTSEFIFFPFPEELIIDQDNKLDKKIEICDNGEILGVFYYGNVRLDNVPDYFGSLYLISKDSDTKYYLSAHSEMEEEGVNDIIEVVKRIKKK